MKARLLILSVLSFLLASVAAVAVVQAQQLPILPAGVPTDPSAIVQLLLQATQAGHWRIVVGIVLVGCIWLARQGAGRLPGRLGQFFRGDRGGLTLTVIIGELGAVASVLFSSVKLTPWVVLDGAVMGLFATGVYTAIKKLIWGVPGQAKVAVTPAPVVLLEQQGQGKG